MFGVFEWRVRRRECSLKNTARHRNLREANSHRDMTLIGNGDGIAWRAKPWKLIAVPGGLPSPVSPVLELANRVDGRS